MSYRTPLARARGLGSAGRGSHEWWLQRLLSVALVPLSLWLALALALLPDTDYQTVLAWIRRPLNGVLLFALIGVSIYHSILGLQVIVEDYIHENAVKLAAIIGVRLALGFLALAAFYATVRIILA